MEIITVKIPRKMLFLIDSLVEEGYFPSRSEIIRDAIRLFLKHYEHLIKKIPERKLILATP